MRFATTLVFLTSVPLALCACDKPAATPPDAVPEAPLPAESEPAPAIRQPSPLVDPAGAVAALARLASCLEKAKAGAESAVATNAAMVRNPGGDLKQAYAAFCSEVDALGALRKELSTATAAVRSDTSALLARWKDAIEALDDPARKKTGQARLASVRASLDAILQHEPKAREAMRPLLALLFDHQLYLENDLNPQAARSLAGDLKSLAELSANVSSALDQMLEATRSCTESLTAKPE